MAKGSKLATQEDLSKIVTEYLSVLDNKKISKEWRRREYKHIAFWHKYYSDVALSVLKGKMPQVVKGTYKRINDQAQISLDEFSNKQLKTVILDSQEKLTTSVSKLDPKQILPYKSGGRTYTTPEFIDVVHGHFKMHLDYLLDMIKKSNSLNIH